MFHLLSQDSFLASPRLVIAAIEAEALLGLWLLSGWSARGARVTALWFFTLLASMSLYLILDGQRSCGCFGQVTVSPWIAFVLDLAAVAALGMGQPKRAAEEQPRLWLRELLKTGAGAGALLVLMGSLFLLAFGNPSNALAWLRSEAITVEPSVTQVGEGIAGEQRTFSIQLHNHSDHPI